MIPLPALGLGTVPLGNFGRAIADEEALAVVAAAWGGGIRYFDTAPLYGFGLAERRLGHALTELPRDQFLVSTKVGRLLVAGGPPDPTLYDAGRPIYHEVPDLAPVPDFSVAGIRQSLESSLERLGLDRVDVVFLHDPQGHEAAVVDHAYPTLVELRAAGLLRAIGVGTTDVACLQRLVEALPLDLVMIASRVSLLDHSAADELLPRCRDRGVQVVGAGVFNSGLLAAPQPGAMFHYRRAPEDVLGLATALRTACAEFSVPLGAAALCFPREVLGISTVVVGAQTVAQVRDDLTWAGAAIPAALWMRLDELTRT